MNWVKSLRQPLLTRSERRWRALLQLFVLLAVLSVVLVLHPWIHGPAVEGLAVGFVCIGLASFARSRFLAELEASRLRLRDMGWLACPGCGFGLMKIRRCENSITCPECGREESPDSLRDIWREAYAIHLDAWTWELDDSTRNQRESD